MHLAMQAFRHHVPVPAQLPPAVLSALRGQPHMGQPPVPPVLMGGPPPMGAPAEEWALPPDMVARNAVRGACAPAELGAHDGFAAPGGFATPAGFAAQGGFAVGCAAQGVPGAFGCTSGTPSQPTGNALAIEPVAALSMLTMPPSASTDAFGAAFGAVLGHAAFGDSGAAFCATANDEPAASTLASGDGGGATLGTSVAAVCAPTILAK